MADPIKMVCENCGSDDVWRDATAVWDYQAQLWDLGSMFQQEYCVACDCETHIINEVHYVKKES